MDQGHGESIIIECFGMPGAGKTFLAEQIRLILKSDDIVISNYSTELGKSGSTKRILIKIYLILSEAWKNRFSNHYIYRLISLYRIPRRRTIKLTFNWLFICALIRREARHANIVLLDQGIAQALWSSEFYSVDSADMRIIAGSLANLINSLPTSILKIVHISADNYLIRERIKTRVSGKSPLDTDINLWERALNATNRVRELLNYIERDTSLVILSDFNNSGSIDIDTLQAILSAAQRA
jgi:hypothetical protein